MSEKETDKKPDTSSKASVSNGVDKVNPVSRVDSNGGDAAERQMAEAIKEWSDNVSNIGNKLIEELDVCIEKKIEQNARERDDAHQHERERNAEVEKQHEIRIRDLEDQIRELNESALRARADGENARKRATQDEENARKYALRKFAPDLCEICDCLESALKSDSNKSEVPREGVDLTLRKLESILDSQSIRPINPAPGVPFDPAVHQAIAKSADSSAPQNSIAEVVRKGYTIHDQLLRPAEVVVISHADDSDGEKKKVRTKKTRASSPKTPATRKSTTKTAEMTTAKKRARKKISPQRAKKTRNSATKA